MLQSLGDPDPFRLGYRAQIGEFVREVVTGGMDKGEAARWIEEETAEKIAKQNRARFVEVVETELLSLHEGNIARYRLRPGEFNDWREHWN